MAGIYIHIPFCKQACFYCNFHFSTSLKNKNEMLLAIKKELLLRKDELLGEKIETVYFGGGTPSLLTEVELKSIFDDIYKNYDVSKNAEITLEANPDDLSSLKIKELANSPINRLSIGVQSFFDDDLKFMNRAHTSSEAESSILKAQDAGFDNITIDLIYGILNSSNQKWLENLQRTFKLNVSHISSYALTVEEKTALHSFIKKGKVIPVDEEITLQQFNMLVNETKKKGYIQYEISNFGKPDYFSKHNTSYWLGKKYLGVGPSAHSFDKENRCWNVSNNIKYIKSISQNKLPQTIEKLSICDQYNEYVMTGLRTIYGVSLQKIATDFGQVYKDYLLHHSKIYLEKELLFLNNQTIYITDKGRFLADGIASELFLLNAL